MGFDGVWEVEHHFLEEYSHSSASEVFLAAASQRARNIRLGHGILPLPPGFDHPARVAETVATLDLVSDGRVDFGTGETSSGAELAGFGVDRATKREQWEEAIDVVTRMMVEEPFAGCDGRFVLDAAAQRRAQAGAEAAPAAVGRVLAARDDPHGRPTGIGALCFSFVEPEEAGAWVDEYYSVLASEECVPAGFAVNPNVAVVLPMMLPPTRTRRSSAASTARTSSATRSRTTTCSATTVRGGRTSGTSSRSAATRSASPGTIMRPDQAPLGVKILQEGLGSLRGAIGTPEQVRELVSRYEQAGVDQIIFVLQAGRNRHEHIVRVARAVRRGGAAAVRASAREAREAEKAARLSDAVAAALARREPARASDPAHVIAPIDSGPPAAAARAMAVRRGRGRRASRRISSTAR